MKSIIIIVTLCSLILPVSSLSAFEILGTWPAEDVPPRMSVKFKGTPDCQGEWLGLLNAALTWNSVPCSFFYFAPDNPLVNNKNTLVFDGYNNIGFENYGDPYVIAVTFIWFSTEDWIAETDIRFNERFKWNCTGEPKAWEMDVENVAAHELGHCLGLDDLYSPSDSSKTMYGYTRFGETNKRTLDQDDIDGVCDNYPALMEGFKGLELLTTDQAGSLWYNADFSPHID
jgi:hypothetical protein